MKNISISIGNIHKSLIYLPSPHVGIQYYHKTILARGFQSTEHEFFDEILMGCRIVSVQLPFEIIRWNSKNPRIVFSHFFKKRAFARTRSSVDVDYGFFHMNEVIFGIIYSRMGENVNLTVSSSWGIEGSRIIKRWDSLKFVILNARRKYSWGAYFRIHPC